MRPFSYLPLKFWWTPGLALLLFFSACKAPWQATTVQPASIRIDSTFQTSSSAQTLIAPYSKGVRETMDAPIATAATALEHRRPEGTLGNWVADVIQAKAQECTGQADFALCNYGGLRIPRLPQGTWTLGLIYELMPFDNVLITVAVPGPVVQQLLDAVAADGGWPSSKELQFKIVDGKATSIKIKGKPLDLTATYQVVLSDYLANGGSNLDFLKPLPRQDCKGILLRDVLIEGAKKAKGPIQVAVEGRITR